MSIPYITTFEADGLTWIARGPTTDDHLGYAPHEQGFYPLLRALLPEGGVFLDVGAHVGRWSLRLARHASKVIAIEANPDTCKILKENADSNGLPVEIYNVAAWDMYTTMGLHDPGGRHCGGSTRTLPDPNGSVSAMPLDHVLQDEPRIDLIKLDVEGADLYALRGMRNLLARHRPVMFIEDHSALGYYEQGDLLALLRSLGYDAAETQERYMSAHYWVARPRD